jgi:hypothetical protein
VTVEEEREEVEPALGLGHGTTLALGCDDEKNGLVWSFIRALKGRLGKGFSP